MNHWKYRGKSLPHLPVIFWKQRIHRANFCVWRVRGFFPNLFSSQFQDPSLNPQRIPKNTFASQFQILFRDQVWIQKHNLKWDPYRISVPDPINRLKRRFGISATTALSGIHFGFHFFQFSGSISPLGGPDEPVCPPEKDLLVHDKWTCWSMREGPAGPQLEDRLVQREGSWFFFFFSLYFKADQHQPSQKQWSLIDDRPIKDFKDQSHQALQFQMIWNHHGS